MVTVTNKCTTSGLFDVKRALLITFFIKMGKTLLKNGICAASQTAFHILWITRNSLSVTKKINSGENVQHHCFRYVAIEFYHADFILKIPTFELYFIPCLRKNFSYSMPTR